MGQVELRDRLLAPVGVRDEAGEVVGANIGALVRRLVLFEQVVLDSFAMRELPFLIDALGPDDFVTLLESDALRIRADGWASAEIGNTDWDKGGGIRDALPPLTFALSSVVPRDREHHIHLCLSEIREMALSRKASKKVRLAIVDALTPIPEGAGLSMIANLGYDVMQHTGLLRTSIAKALEALGRPAATDYDLRVEQLAEVVFRVETDLGDRLGLTLTETDAVLEKAFLGVAGLNQRFEEMERYQALVGFKNDELELADQKLRFLAEQFDPGAHERRFTRVIELGNLPDPDGSEEINVHKLLAVRDSRECREFRQWLRTTDSMPDTDIEDALGNIRETVSRAVRSRAGKAVRFVAATGLGFVPVVGPAAGIAAGAVDAFLVERVLPEPGPVSFLGHSYRSIFES